MSVKRPLDYSEFHDDLYKRRKFADQHIVKKLMNRQTLPIKPNTHFHIARSFYFNIMPFYFNILLLLMSKNHHVF